MHSPIIVFLISFLIISISLSLVIKLLSISIVGAVKLWYSLTEIAYLASKGYYHF